MPAYMVSYDLRKTRNYDPIIELLRQARFISPLESVWFGRSNYTAAEIRDTMRQFMDDDDGLLIVQIVEGADWATYDVNERGETFLSQFVTRADRALPPFTLLTNG